MSTLHVRRAIAVTAAVVCAGALTAQAATVVSFGFTELSGSYDSGSGSFEAVAVAAGVASTTGSVNKLVGPGPGAALFLPGTFDGSTLAAVEFSVSVSNIGTNTAEGSGSFRIVDVDGDEITGTITGTWSTPGFGFIFFNASSSDITFSDAGVGDGSFDGASDGSFDSASLTGAFGGAVTLLFQLPTFSFFDGDFGGLHVQTTGVVVPSPAPAALLALGGLFALPIGRRNRRA